MSLASLEEKRKELAHQKEKLLVASKAKAVTMDGVKTQIDNLMKVSDSSAVPSFVD